LNPQELEGFEDAKKLVRNQRYAQALPVLQILHKRYPEDGEVERVLDYCQSFKKDLGEPWANNSFRQKPVQQPPKKSNRFIGVLALILIIVFFIFQSNKSSSPSTSPAGVDYATSAPKDSNFNYSLSVTGHSTNSKFEGTCLVYKSNGGSSSFDASGTTPATLYYTGNLISCTVQMSGTGGSLHVVLSRSGSQIAVGNTSNDYGVVSVAGR
jgi:hypothetical protein